MAIIIPALNEEDTIRSVVSGCSAFGDPVVIDDGSTDHTASESKAGGAVAVIGHTTNQGYDASLRSGFVWAEQHHYDAFVTFDADGQYPASLLQEFRSYLDAGADLVLGIRARGARVSERVFSAYTMGRYGVPDILCGVKGYSTALYRANRRVVTEKSIGTALALAGLRNACSPVMVPTSVLPRAGVPRFGSGVRPNARIGWALALALTHDAASTTHHLCRRQTHRG
jgi:glycosyltransferase involved in cell wall biosynthesis